jgi:hypothetical protein
VFNSQVQPCFHACQSESMAEPATACQSLYSGSFGTGMLSKVSQRITSDDDVHIGDNNAATAKCKHVMFRQGRRCAMVQRPHDMLQSGSS